VTQVLIIGNSGPTISCCISGDSGSMFAGMPA